jgi:hypothetical protein
MRNRCDLVCNTMCGCAQTLAASLGINPSAKLQFALIQENSYRTGTLDKNLTLVCHPRLCHISNPSGPCLLVESWMLVVFFPDGLKLYKKHFMCVFPCCLLASLHFVPTGAGLCTWLKPATYPLLVKCGRVFFRLRVCCST